ncbi:hypothetical protein HZS_5103 [Henneguya salminicola]|nr:hypothetical protein HZS_5103 [Henneguya salminicola]
MPCVMFDQYPLLTVFFDAIIERKISPFITACLKYGIENNHACLRKFNRSLILFSHSSIKTKKVY